MTPNAKPTLLKLAQIVALVVLCLAAFDLALRMAVPDSAQVLQKTVDIQTPETLFVKLDQFRRFEGIKVVVLGDSLAFGRTMRDKGDAQWENHTLSAQLQSQLERDFPAQKIMVLNLGMNGTVPSDLDNLIRIILPLKPDLVVFDVSMRSLSRDFDGERQVTRPWLADLSVSPEGNYATGSLAHDVMVNHWYLYRLKDMFQQIVFDGQPVTWLAQKRDQLDAKIKGTEPPVVDDLIILMKARKRYDTIDLKADNPQRIALESVMTRLKDAGQPAIGFYATENPEKRPDLIEDSKFNPLQAELKAIMKGDTVKWFGPLNIYASDDYLDHVHLSAGGYTKLITHLSPDVKKLLAGKEK